MIKYELIELEAISDEQLYESRKASAIRAYKISVTMFCDPRYSAEQKMWIAERMDERARVLIRDFGMDWDEVDALEIDAMRGDEAFRNGMGACIY